ncbi:MAG: quinolinate synthase NadA [Candidatus Aminicenantes bacterium]|nr:quinolinate synthase NadA [Candidatus Aminicenantes bacterium]
MRDARGFRIEAHGTKRGTYPLVWADNDAKYWQELRIDLAALTPVVAKPHTVDNVVPVTYQNSYATVKAFCGKNGGAVCTSANAQAILRWALKETPPGRDGVPKGEGFSG